MNHADNPKDTRPCPSCGSTMAYGVRPETITYQGHSLTYNQPGWHCTECDDGIVEGADNEVADIALHELMAQVKDSPISPLVIRAAREAVGLSQREAGRIFGGGPTAFYKYETAKAVPSEGMANLLRLALERPDLFKKKPVHRAIPTAQDIALIRKSTTNDHLNAIIHFVYQDENLEVSAS